MPVFAPQPLATPAHAPRSSTGRAELLRALLLARQHGRAEAGLAYAAGYAKDTLFAEPELAHEDAPRQQTYTLSPPPPNPNPNTLPKPPRPQARFWAVTQRTPNPPVAGQEIPAVTHAPLSLADVQASPGAATPALQSIAPLARMMPALKRSLQAQRSGALDMAQLVHSLSHGKTPRRLPRLTLRGWTDRLLVVLDLSEPLLPYRADIHQLAYNLRRWAGRGNVQVRVVLNERQPLGHWQEWALDIPGSTLRQPTLGTEWASAATAARILVISELGLVAKDQGSTSEAWAKWFTIVGKQGTSIQVWCPLPIGLPSTPAHAPPGWQQAAATLPRMSVVHWSAASRLRAHALPTSDLHRTPARMVLADKLRTQLATVARLEPALLRAMRIHMGRPALDAGLEHLVWDHPDMTQSYSARSLQAGPLPSYRALFAQLPSAQKLSLLDTLLAHHTPFNPLLAHIETLTWAAHATPDERTERQAEVDAAHTVMRRFAHNPWLLSNVNIERAEITHFMARHLRDADDATKALFSPYLSRMHVALHRERHGDQPLTDIPSGLATADIAKALGTLAAPQTYWLAHDGASNTLVLTQEKPQPSRLLDAALLELQALSIQVGQQALRWEEASAQSDIALMRLPQAAHISIRGEKHTMSAALRLDTGLETITIEEIPRPAWALEWARDAQGLYALAPTLWGAPLRVPYPNLTGEETKILSQFIYTNYEPRKVRNTLTLEEDLIGLQATFVLNDEATQSLRYLPPGQFLMGSPSNEHKREDDEGPQHWVTLTEGLWLADTACTQALWLAVMGGKNPSDFKGDPDLPVENVSWDDVQQFLAKLQAYLPPGVQAVLPTEAEWEYACRAGSSTPFSFGQDITPEQVNYDGNYPYQSGKKGLYRKKTVPVKALPANDWGLYQMHGNVWEWCADAKRTYTEEAVTNPSGATGKKAEDFAVRGGSWLSNARDARSAQRARRRRDFRFIGLGLRFALRSTAQQGAGGPGPEGSPLLGQRPSSPRDGAPSGAVAPDFKKPSSMMDKLGSALPGNPKKSEK